MASQRPTLRTTQPLAGPGDSLWGVKESYRAYRHEIAGIFKPKGVIEGPTSPAVARILEDVEIVKNDILPNTNTEQLANEILANPAVKLARVPTGSHMLVIFQGGNDETNIKHFNDELLGPEVTNVLIAMRDEVIAAGLKYFKLADDDTCVSSDHKTCHYCINQVHIKMALDKLQETLPADNFRVTTDISAIGSSQSLEVISYVMQRIERDIQEAARTILEAKIVTLLGSEDGQNQIRKIRFWLQKQLGNIKLNFGLSEEVHTVLGGQEALKDRFWIDQQATWSARKAEGSVERGKSFDLLTFVDDINAIRQEALEDEDLDEFFEEINNDGQPHRLLKLDVIHNLRKWATVKKQYANNDAILAKYQKLQRYYQAINGIDYITPWVDIQSADAAISHFETITSSPDNIDELKRAILMDQRNNKDCTSEYFHYQGTEFNAAYYISFDAIGIGDINARDIELTAIKAIRHLHSHRSTKSTKTIKADLQEIIMSVGQNVSVLLRDAFDNARTEIEAALPNVTLYTTRGGDEWHVLIGDPYSFDPEQLFDTIARIAQKYHLRATISYKDSSVDASQPLHVNSDLERVEAHYKALDLNEQNNAKIKQFEKEGLTDIVAISREHRTAAKIPYKGGYKEVSIASIAGAIEVAKGRDLTINEDTIVGILVGAAI